jgi:cytidylate kinase
MVIGIEGLVGAGKTSICRNLINRIPNTVLLNGGNLYRAIVYISIKNGKTANELSKAGKSLDIKEMMDIFNINIRVENNETMIYAGNEKLDEEVLQSKEASLAVSKVGGSANNEKLFEFARELINELKKDYNVVISGRSIMQIYPDTDYHFFITADLDERVKRKCSQYNNKEEYEEIKKNIMQRDELQEKAGFYKLSPNTIILDVTNCKSIEESTDLLLSKINLKEPECV